jgi:hypothetical protein
MVEKTGVKMTQLGQLGERIIADFLRKEGHQVSESLTNFDREKDMLAGDLKIEVKTQVPFFTQDAFSFRTSQEWKCLESADVVYFVCVPLEKKDDPFAGCIFAMDPKKVKPRKFTTRDSREMILIDRVQEGMTVVHTITDKAVLRELRELSGSKW